MIAGASGSEAGEVDQGREHRVAASELRRVTARGRSRGSFGFQSVRPVTELHGSRTRDGRAAANRGRRDPKLSARDDREKLAGSALRRYRSPEGLAAEGRRRAIKTIGV